MHALITADTIGGVWTYVRELVAGLVGRGAQVTLVSFGQIPAPHQTKWMEGLPGLDFRPTGFRLEWMQEAERDLELSAEYLLSVVRETRPDIIHLNQYAYGALEVDVPKLVVAHSDVVSWWVAVHGEEPPESKWSCWYRDTVLRGLLGATAVVAPSRAMLDALASFYTPPAVGKVIYNGRTQALFNGQAEKENYAVSVGRLWDGAKQISLLTQIEPPLPVHIVGSEQHPDAAYRHSTPRTRKGNIRFRGELGEEALRHLYNRAALYVATSRYEPFGLAPLEAALARCALVLNDIPSFHELWGENAYYFRHNDSDSLAGALRQLAEDREMRIVYGNLAYHHARQRFGVDRMVDEYWALYRSLVPLEVEAA